MARVTEGQMRIEDVGVSMNVEGTYDKGSGELHKNVT